MACAKLVAETAAAGDVGLIVDNRNVPANVIPLVQPALSADECAVIYARFSTKNQDPRSIDDQVRNCHRHIAEEGLTAILVLKDEAISGFGADDREGLQQLLTLARRKPLLFKHVVIDDSSRLSRDNIDSQTIVFRTLRSAGVVVHDVANRIRSDDDHAEMFWGVRSLIDSMYVRDIRKKVIRGMEGRAVAGFSTGGQCFGYTSAPEPNPENPDHPRRIIVVLPTEADVVRRIFKMFVDGMGSFGIADLLNREGVSAPRKQHWDSTCVEHLLNNERYIGKMVWRKSEWQKDPLTKKYKAKPRPKSEWIIRENPALRIVPQELWDEIRKLRESRGKFRPGRPIGTKNAVRPLTGLVFCGVCGGPLYAITSVSKKRRKAYVAYGCGNRRRGGDSVCSMSRMMAEEKVRDAIITHTSKFLSSKEFDEWVEVGRLRYLDMKQREKKAKNETSVLAEAIRAQEARVERVLEMVADGAGSSELLKRKLATEEAKLVALRGQVARLLRPRVTDKLPPVDAPALRAQMERLGEIFDARPEEARGALRKFIRRVVMHETPSGVKLTVSLVSSVVLPAPENSGALLQSEDCGDPHPGVSRTWRTGPE